MDAISHTPTTPDRPLIENGFLEFMKACQPASGPVSEIQFTEMRRAFYGGIFWMHSTLMFGIGVDPEPTADELQLVARIDEELHAFADAVSRGVA